MFDYQPLNQELKQSTPQSIIERALALSERPVVTTNFGPFEAVILHMVTQIQPDIPVIWIDSGYNTRDTYKTAEKLIEDLKLNVDVFTPKVSAARRDAALGGIPAVDDEGHDEFTRQFKLEPFTRAMDTHQPDVWFTAVRSEQTAFRENMEVFSTGLKDIVKVAPVLHWKESDMQAYLEQHGLPNVEKYFDPTKAEANRECGLHTRL